MLKPRQPRVDHVDYRDFLNDAPTIDLHNFVAAAQRARGRRGIWSMDVLRMPIAYNSYSSFLLNFPKCLEQSPMTASQRESAERIPSPSTYRQFSTAQNVCSPLLPTSLDFSLKLLRWGAKVQSRKEIQSPKSRPGPKGAAVGEPGWSEQ